MPNDQEHKHVIHTKKHVARLERERQQTRLIMYLFVGIVVAVIGLLVYGYLDVNVFQLRKPVAKVGEVEISAADFETAVRIQRTQLLNNYQQNLQFQQLYGMDVTQQQQQIEQYLGTPGLIGQRVIDQLIDEEIVRQEAVKLGLSVSAQELDDAIQSEFGYFPNGTNTPTIVPTEFATLKVPAEAYTVVTRTPVATATVTALPDAEVTLEATVEPTATLVPTATPTSGPTATAVPTATAYTLDGYKNEYATAVAGFGKFGMTEATYREFIEIRLLREKIKEVVVKDLPSTSDKVWARHILVADEALAVTLIERIKAGEDFGELAKEFSTDTGSGANGGDLGWFGTGAMVAEFETAAFALANPGDITETPVQSQFGYHIIQLIAKQAQPMTADEISQARDTKFTDWLAATRETYTIEINEDFWRARDPKDPNFVTIATEGAETAIAAATEQAQATSTPKP